MSTDANHYAAALGIHRLRLSVKLGLEEGERLKAQPVEIDVRFYFPKLPAACKTDEGDFLCYDDICAAITECVTRREFKLIEYLALEIFNLVRGQVKDDTVKIGIRLLKCVPPVPNMLGGASFTYSDLPPGANIEHLL